MTRLFLFLTVWMGAVDQPSEDSTRIEIEETTRVVPVQEMDSSSVLRDTIFREALSVPEGRIDSFRALPEYRYDRPQRERPSLLDMVVRWLERTIFGPLNRALSSRPGEWVLFSLAAAAILWALLKVLRSGLRSPFERREQENATASDLLDIENIQAVDLHVLLEEAREAGRLRDGVRFRFLIALQSLEKAELLAWSREKTNRDFLREVQGKDARLGREFSRVMRAFEYVWYGNLSLNTDRMKRIESDFESFDRSIDTATE